MQSIPLHIAYLLTQHNCVTLSGLGAFIVSSSGEEKINRWGIISPPENILDFNPEIQHNDGLLANSIAKEKKISFEEANLLIDQYVTYILHSLNEGEKIEIPGVGILYSKNNIRSLQPDKTLSCNILNYGLNRFSLPYLKDIQQPVNNFSEKKNKETVLIPSRRKSVFYSGLFVIALIAMCIVPVSLNNDRFSPKQTQVSISMQNTGDEEENVSETELFMQGDSSLMQTETETQPSKTISIVRVTALHYYIIIASFQDQSLAKKTLSVIQSKGFENAAILSTDEKYHIYTNHFEDKAEAERFLIQFKQEYPGYSNAWMLSSLPPNQSE